LRRVYHAGNAERPHDFRGERSQGSDKSIAPNTRISAIRSNDFDSIHPAALRQKTGDLRREKKFNPRRSCAFGKLYRELIRVAAFVIGGVVASHYQITAR